MKLYLTRHGETEWNVAKKLQGWENSHLTENGLKRAHQFKELVKDVKFDKIYTSNQKRAVDTANIIKNGRDIPIIELQELRELSFGNWEGRTLADIKNKDAELFDIFLNSPLLYKPSSGESISDLFKRAKLALSKIGNEDGENILIVSHGVTIRAIITILKNLDIDGYKEIPVYPGASLSIFEKHETGWISIIEGDISHFNDIVEEEL